MSTPAEQLAALLAAVFADPENDDVRLIFADWLTEQGDPRGDLMRVQCTLARLPEDDPGREALVRQEADLHARHATALWGHRPAYLDVAFERGLLAVQTTGDVLAQGRGAKWWHRHRVWVCRLTLA